MSYEIVIGLEVHIQLNTNSKIFCSSAAQFGDQPNKFIDPVTLGFPGALPVVNKKVIDYAIMLGIATSCEIRKLNRFARKHYFYPDSPKGYQISQFDEPICERGHLDILTNSGSYRSIGITRIHMEEDAGKSIHDPANSISLVDLNRAGTPLLEIVSEPDLRSPEEASAYLKTLRQLVRFLKISDGNMEEGSLRCDANISLRPSGQTAYGTRTELKNINSFKFVEKALNYEVARQTAILNSGKEIQQATLLYDSDTNTTHVMRTKEESADYRYMPDPDLPPIVISDSWINEISSKLPPTPKQYKKKLIETYGLSDFDVEVLTAEPEIVTFFEKTVEICANAKSASNWITSELFGFLNRENLNLSQSPIKPEALGKLIKLIDEDVISGKMAKQVFEKMPVEQKDPETIVKELGLSQIIDPADILALVKTILENNPKQIQQYLEGNERVIGYFIGQIMKVSKGSANPKLANKILMEELSKIH